MMKSEDSEVMSGKETAVLLKSDYTNVMRKAKSGEIPSFRFGGKVLFRRSTLEAWMARQETQSLESGQKDTKPGALRRIAE